MRTAAGISGRHDGIRADGDEVVDGGGECADDCHLSIPQAVFAPMVAAFRATVEAVREGPRTESHEDSVSRALWSWSVSHVWLLEVEVVGRAPRGGRKLLGRAEIEGGPSPPPLCYRKYRRPQRGQRQRGR